MSDAPTSSPKPTLGSSLVTALYLALFVALGSFAWQRPTWEWDLLGYLGCLEEFEGSSPEAAHRSVYDQIDAVAPREAAQLLRSKVPYREQLASDPAAFEAQLPFYRGRVVYLFMLEGLSRLGIAPVRAAYLISVLAGLILAWIVLQWLCAHWPPLQAAVISALGLLAAGFLQVSSLATPDMLAAVLVISGAWCLLERQSFIAGIALFLLAVGTRADHLVLIGPLLLYAATCLPASKRLGKGMLVVALVLLAGAFLAFTAGRGTHGWWTVYHHTFFGYKAFPLTETPAMDFMVAIKRGLRSLPQFRAYEAFSFAILAVASTYFGWRRLGPTNRIGLLPAVVMLALLMHFFLLPVLWPRLMLPYWILIALAAGMVFAPTKQPSQSGPAV